MQLKVASIAEATARIKAIELVDPSGASLPAFAAGAHLDIDIPQIGDGEARSYSLINDPRETHRYVIAVQREENSRGGSEWIHAHLQTGDILESSPPLNNFALNEAGEHHLLIAGGIGVTPILAMARRLAALQAPFHIHYCARSRDMAAFVETFEAEFPDRFTLHLDGGDPARGLDVATLLQDRTSGGHAYVCGPAGLIRAVRETTSHWPKGSVHYELFRGAEDDTAPRSSDAPFEIVLQRSGKHFTVPADKSILDVLKAEGFRIKTLCREGVCGTCRTSVISGGVDHRDDVLTDEERETEMQVCVSRALPGQTLVLDL
ncbi:vanillate O-demethylase ferredoxin subunit [Beijerinckia sp. 28-YEA-48]|nr:vanillate O-demethylase ferredoxin subunit [Beijerinckia sp. 28-YEA-48]